MREFVYSDIYIIYMLIVMYMYCHIYNEPQKRNLCHSIHRTNILMMQTYTQIGSHMYICHGLPSESICCNPFKYVTCIIRMCYITAVRDDQARTYSCGTYRLQGGACLWGISPIQWAKESCIRPKEPFMSWKEANEPFCTYLKQLFIFYKGDYQTCADTRGKCCLHGESRTHTHTDSLIHTFFLSRTVLSTRKRQTQSNKKHTCTPRRRVTLTIRECVSCLFSFKGFSCRDAFMH